MAETVVEVLEVVDVDHDQRHGCVALHATCDLAWKRVFHRVTVAEPGECIGRSMLFELAQLSVAFGNHLVVTAHPLGQDDEQVLRKLVRGVDHFPEYGLVNDEQVRVLRTDDVRGWVTVLDDRHLSNAGARFHRSDNWPTGRSEVHVQASGEHDEHILVSRTRRQQQFAAGQVAAVTALQLVLHVLGAHALEQFQGLQQRAFIVRVHGQRLFHSPDFVEFREQKKPTGTQYGEQNRALNR